MTFVQLPAIVQTAKYKDLLEDFEASKISNNINNKWISEPNDLTPYLNINYFNDYNYV